MKKYSVGILGATGMVGQRFVSLLENHPWFEIKVLAASERSAGKTYIEAVKAKWVMDTKIPEKVSNMVLMEAFKDAEKIASMVDFVFCAVGAPKEWIKELETMYAKLECPVISNNSAHRDTLDVPMIIPEINPQHSEIIPAQRRRLKTKKGFIAVKSNCSLQCYLPAAYPLMDLDVTKILVCTYQAVSGAGKTLSNWEEMQDNIIPFIPGEEEKSEKEPLKILGKLENDKITLAQSPSITSQCIRVPVSDGHTAAVFMAFNKKASLDEIIERWENYSGYSQSLNLPSSPKRFLYYFKEEDRPQIKKDLNLESGMSVEIGRLREDKHYNIKFICMAHNTIRGAAGGAVLMAELLCREGYI
jgi:aspartate-semialdehyde dehydrogenase (non-peptidoglycan organisms)